MSEKAPSFAHITIRWTVAETVFVIFTVKLVKWSKIHKLDYFDYYWARAEVSNPIFWGAEFVTPNPFSWLLSIYFLKKS